jgi:S-adenosylmethionine hydrolase
MKGVIWSIAPGASIADLSHEISPQDIAEGALILFRSAPYFPPETVHIAVVDPGVGTDRRPIAARLGEQFYVCPDNGLLTMLLERAGQQEEATRFVHLNRPQYWRKEVSHVFHGRDIFAPCGAYLAAGTPLEDLGDPISDPVRLELPKPRQTATGWKGEVIHIDHFGNVATNIRVEHLGELPVAEIRIGAETIHGMVQTFGERPVGSLIALFGSTDNLIVSVVNGSAARRLGARLGDPVEVRL